MRPIVLSLALLFCSYASAATVSDFGALHGCWTMPATQGTFQEYYTAPAGGVMFGTDQFIGSTTTGPIEWGAFTLVQNGTSIQYGYSESGQAYLLYDLASFTGSGGDFVATFSNPALTDVNKVTVTLTGSNALNITLGGPGPDGGLTFNLNRVAGAQDCSSVGGNNNAK